MAERTAATAAPAGFQSPAPARDEAVATAAFPDGFVWGAASAAYQIEGAVSEDGRGPSIWDAFSRRAGAVFHGDTGDIACDHYHRVVEDLDLMRALGLRSYRFSVAWPRVQPDGCGAPNQAGLDFYRRLVDGLLERGIAPSLTLYHWDLPQTLQDAGGWPDRGIVARFADYAAIVARAVGDRVPLWTTVNEPWVASWLGYGVGLHAPGIADLRAAAIAHHHLLLAHGAGLQALRAELGTSSRIGVALSMMSVSPATDHPADVAAADIVDAQFNRSCAEPLLRGRYPRNLDIFSHTWADESVCRPGDLELISAPLDYLGINSYHPRLIVSPSRLDAVRGAGFLGHHDPLLSFGMDVADVVRQGTPVTALGWPVVPSGMRDLLLRVQRDYGVPIYVTENGAAYPDYVTPEGVVHDPERIAYLDGYLRAVHEAIALGADVRGYYVWTLLDNFEWGSGYSKRFGLVYVDFPTSRRIPKTSFAWYRDVIRRNAVASTDLIDVPIHASTYGADG